MKTSKKLFVYFIRAILIGGAVLIVFALASICVWLLNPTLIKTWPSK